MKNSFDHFFETHNVIALFCLGADTTEYSLNMFKHNYDSHPAILSEDFLIGGLTYLPTNLNTNFVYLDLTVFSKPLYPTKEELQYFSVLYGDTGLKYLEIYLEEYYKYVKDK